ncbi:MAG: amidase [Alphaproteobacteria bacterium]|jgi:aspartyl-tRNA(Asn)/glutamyl-tRNA(Gln) amidotransferase subunit A|nr:amidase [Rhodospirillaceae bacterium]MDP6023806.1 amidase [Alphaproteobacteria bacterium]MDP6254166.1 amidase [Alphaproteobacteria bacterium]MDP7055020.1 amidase [Alphaproteobacteria bacterium]MDP7230181.1 amidase [Alphaproteobacteria bacterium]|tara:strand:- start:648 stop:2015 length:1368 start_codon:yes stop_codon:yes gene_type:complete
MIDPANLDITGTAEALAAGDFTAEDLLRAYLARIERYEAGMNCFITLLEEPALEQARASDARRAKGERLSPLDGIPIALKDNIDLAGVPTTNGMARFRTPVRDAAITQRLRDAGAVFLGKVNMHEGALGATTNNPHHGAAQNPWRPGFTPGGSSGGSAVAVAAGFCAGALGTDTMGSVRLPASYCGLVGLKATQGLISTRGVVPLSYGLDHVGPICRSSRDLSLMLAILVGHDPESTESIHPHRALRTKGVTLQGLRFSVPLNLAAVACGPGIRENFEAHLAALERQGAVQVDLRFPTQDCTGTRRAGLLISEAEAGHALEAELLAHPDDFSDEFRQNLEYGRSAPAHRLVAAQRQLLTVGQRARKLFDEVDLLLLPTAPQAAFSHSDKAPVNQADFTQWANHSGCPALSLPCGLSPDGMPLGLQLLGQHRADRRLLAMAELIEPLLPELPMPAL